MNTYDAANAILDFELKNPARTYTIGLFTTLPIRDETSGIEATGGGYLRKAITLGTPATGSVFNSNEITWTATGPTLETRSSGEQLVNSLTHAITLPSGILPGELLLLIFSCDGNPTCSTASSGWVKLGQASNGAICTGAIFYKLATGSNACTVDTTASEQSTHVVLRVSGAGIPTGTSANGDSADSDPPSHNAGSSKDHLWVATRSGDAQVVATVAPTNYSNLQSKLASNTDGASTNTAERQLTAQTENPGTFTSGAEQWVSWTVAVPPAAWSQGLAMAGFCIFDDLTNLWRIGTFTVPRPVNVGSVVRLAIGSIEARE